VIAFRREFAYRSEHDLKNHVSPVRFWPSAQDAFAGLRGHPVLPSSIVEEQHFVEKRVTE
jgi:hypothetical protein